MKDWDDTLAINLTAALVLSQAFATQLLAEVQKLLQPVMNREWNY